jgi:hypothetical protein
MTARFAASGKNLEPRMNTDKNAHEPVKILQSSTGNAELSDFERGRLNIHPCSSVFIRGSKFLLPCQLLKTIKKPMS